MAEFSLSNKGSITIDFERGVVSSILSGSTELTFGETPLFELRLLEDDGTKHEFSAKDATSVALTDDGAIYGGFERGYYTVDGVHPNDAGFLRIADVIGYEVQRMLNRFTLLKK